MNQATRRALLFVIVVGVTFSIYSLESKKVVFSPTAGADATINLDTIGTPDTMTPAPGATTTSVTIVGTTTTPSATIALAKPARTADFAQLRTQYPAAKELVSPDAYINTGLNTDGSGKSITIKSLIGQKVVLLDFWTYSCINCQRTLPYVTAWDAKYKDLGLEIIGVHAPEFEFEKVLSNVQAAVVKFGIHYPVVLDSEMRTWNAYSNQYWPEHYLIDINGLVVDKHIGEGGYAETEHLIQKLLQERATALGLKIAIPTDVVDVSKVAIQSNSPETYFGSGRNEYLGNGTQSQQGVQTLTDPTIDAMQSNQLYLGGTWNFSPEYATTQSADAHIFYRYDAQHVYFVASSATAGQGISITVMRDGVPLTTDRGADVDAKGTVLITTSRLYDLINQPSMSGHTLEIIVHNPGLQAYTFTFG